MRPGVASSVGVFAGNHRYVGDAAGIVSWREDGCSGELLAADGTQGAAGHNNVGLCTGRSVPDEGTSRIFAEGEGHQCGLTHAEHAHITGNRHCRRNCVNGDQWCDRTDALVTDCIGVGATSHRDGGVAIGARNRVEDGGKNLIRNSGDRAQCATGDHNIASLSGVVPSKASRSFTERECDYGRLAVPQGRGVAGDLKGGGRRINSYRHHGGQQAGVPCLIGVAARCQGNDSTGRVLAGQWGKARREDQGVGGHC